MKKNLLFTFLFLTLSFNISAQKPFSVRVAESFMDTHRDSILIGANKYHRWDYEQGIMLKALEQVWYRTNDVTYFNYIQKDIDSFVQEDGIIKTYKFDDFNIDNTPPARALLMLYNQTLPDKEKYRKAADLIRKQLAEQPRNTEGGFWHKNRYPNQMWLDGLFMGTPFYAEYSAAFNQPQNFNDIALQFELIEKHNLDLKTGLLHHAWDESKLMPWADKTTGKSPNNFWGRAIGWYAVALVEVLDYFPQNHSKRQNLISYLQRLAPVLARYQDPVSGCWWQIVDKGGKKGNYLEASFSSMCVYALAKGVRMGYLDKKYLITAKKGYAGILKNFISTDTNGKIHLEKTVSVGGLGGTPYRDGSYDYYLSEPTRQDDLKGIGPFIMAGVEMEITAENSIGKGKTVGLDYYFNHEFRKDQNGNQEQFHYTWEDKFHSGFWWWGNIYRQLGAKTVSIPASPTAQNLKNIDVYIIVDPDTKKETTNPNFIQEADIQEIIKWVKAGGTLVLMANDTSNCEHPHLNQLAAAFGIQFTAKNRNMVQGTQWEQGRLDIPANHVIFKNTQAVYIKELSVLDLKSPAQSILTDKGDVIFAVSKVGKGKVFAVGDPWLYNEYVDGRRIPAIYQNFNAAKDLAIWLLR